MTLFDAERVLVPIDFSEAAFEAQEATLAWVPHPSHLHVLHVLPHLNPGDPGMAWQTVTPITRRQHVVQAFRDRFPAPEYEQVQFTVLIGDPSTEIVDYAKQKKISLIVLPSHGRTGLGRLMIGSVAERVVRLAPCPVLVLRR